ncbi:MAG TPA: prolyl oligopeptidase family serine peptidase, partial [Mycobacteriales bacterium]|nr:prolyl oligopeptidase family serine peptidase [Mycobacteriales bacterium]
WILHSLGVNHNQYVALDPNLIQQECQDRHSICAGTLGFAPDGWYFDEAEVDFWQVWHALAAAYPLDTERTVISGYSMGGWATYKLGLAHPDLFSEALSLEGPPTCGIRVIEELDGTEVRAPATSGRCTDDGTSVPLLQNARSLPYVMTQGAIDELVPLPSVIQVAQDLDKLGYRYHFFFLPAEDHLVYATQDRFGPQVLALGGTPNRVVNPAHITYAWFPNLTRSDLAIGTTTAYWITGLSARSNAPGVIAKVDATSSAITDPAVSVQHATGLFANPLAQAEYALTWKAGAKPVAKDALQLTLTGVQGATVQLPRARLTCPAITATSDGATTLTLAGLPTGASVVRGSTVVAKANAGRTARIALTNGTNALQVMCHAVSAHPPTAHAGPPVTAPGGALAATGLGVLPWTALASLAGFLIVRRRASGPASPH